MLWSEWQVPTAQCWGSAAEPPRQPVIRAHPGYFRPETRQLFRINHSLEDISCRLASGSFPVDAMVAMRPELMSTPAWHPVPLRRAADVAWYCGARAYIWGACGPIFALTEWEHLIAPFRAIVRKPSGRSWRGPRCGSDADIVLTRHWQYRVPGQRGASSGVVPASKCCSVFLQPYGRVLDRRVILLASSAATINLQLLPRCQRAHRPQRWHLLRILSP